MSHLFHHVRHTSGLGVHHVHAHKERLPNRECHNCNYEFYSDTNKKFCSRRCLLESGTFAGKNNPNYQGGQTETQCVICGAKFSYYPSEKKGLYCKSCVDSEDWRHRPDLHGQNNPQWSGGKQEYSCSVCENTIERYPSETKSEAIVCSESCRRTYLSESYSGEGHPNWKGGGNEAYGPGWAAARREALERDNYRCRRCGTGREKLGRNPDVHHIVPVRRFIEAEECTRSEAHIRENLISLCPHCLRNADFGNISPAALRALLSEEAIAE